jgi:hypothetical protein
MGQTYSEDVHLIRVTDDYRKHYLWVARTERREAVAAVLNAVPEGWSAILLDTRLKSAEANILGLKPGEVREVTAA